MRSCPKCHRGWLDEEVVCPLDGANLDHTVGRLPNDVGRVLGSYRLIGLVGEGAMGRVFVARHLRLKRLAAIKWLKPELSERRVDVGRFFDEARVVNEIKHPNIIDVFDLVEDVFAGGYYVMELLAGRELRDEMATPMDPERAARIGAQVAAALHAVHEHGIVHRDLKPENVILLDRGGPPGSYDFPKIVDFGVAKMADEEAEGVPFGTPRYMAPEQAGSGTIDGRADQYSLGVILYEMVTGEHPFPSRNDNEYLMRHADEVPVPPARRMPPGRWLAPDLDRVILRCLAKKPEDRFESGAALAVALRGVDFNAPRKKSRSWLALVGLVAAAAGTWLAWTTFAAKPQKPAVTASTAPPPPSPSPASAPAPAPAPAPPPPPERVTLTFRSSPPGASVYRVGETVPIGTTPFEQSFLKSSASLVFRFEIAGRESVEESATLGQAQIVEATLRKPERGRPRPSAAPPAAATRDKDAPGAGNREGVMDPFAR